MSAIEIENDHSHDRSRQAHEVASCSAFGLEHLKVPGIHSCFKVSTPQTLCMYVTINHILSPPDFGTYAVPGRNAQRHVYRRSMAMIRLDESVWNIACPRDSEAMMLIESVDLPSAVSRTRELSESY